MLSTQKQCSVQSTSGQMTKPEQPKAMPQLGKGPRLRTQTPWLQ